MTPQNQFGTLLQQGSINVFLVEPTIDIPYKHILKVVDSNQLELRNQLTNEAKILHKLEGQIGKRLLKEGFTDGKKSLWLKYLEGQNLSDLLKNRADFKINDFYHLALEICKELKKIHDLGITHGNISAENIIKTHKSGIEFVNFQLSLTQSTKYFQYSNFELIPDFLESMAPEQTGKVNWSVDRRTDLYSLGMIFFRILVGRPAFHFNDLNDYAFAHILEKPPQIHSLNREIPTPLSKVIEKLIEKFPENRYQSIEGLISDLKALKNIQPSKLESFEIGLNDFSDNLNITEELIAKHEVINNLSKFMLDSNQLNLKLALLTGPTGTGKNKVAYELASKIGQTNGIMLYGKFHGNGHNQPFSGFIDVIKMYLQHIQTRDSLKLEEWQRKVNQLLGPQIESLIHFVPDLRNLFNNQNLTIQIIDSENQILYLFAKLISSFSDPSRPVVLMLDDLQWADSNSIKLIEFILKLDDFPFLNILATQREEVVLNKEVENLISNFEHHSAIFKKFTLKNFDEQETCEFIAKSIMRPFNQVESLSKIIFEKTQGNPFYLMRFIQAIYEEKELYFHHEFREWMWNAEAIESRNITNNVVDFIIDRFGTLDSISTDIAVLAANYGRVFPENIFQWVYKNKYTALQIHESLENLLELKIIVVSNHYPDLKCIDPYEELSFFEFKHDRLVEAALHKRGSAPNQHWEIGIALLENVTFESLRKSQQLYSVANHLNLGIKDKSISDYERLFQINLETGDEAKKAASFQLALDFYSKANEYASNIDISESERIDLNLKLAETKQFTGKSEEAETLYLSLFSNHADLETKALVGEKIIHFYTNNANYKKAYEFGCRLLSEFGIKFHLKPSKPRLIFQVIKTRILLSKHNIPDLINLPIADDIYHKMVIKCIASMLKSAYQIAPELCVEGAAKMVQQCLKKGNSPDSPVGYFVFGGIFIGGIMGDHQKGFEFGEMSLQLVKKLNSYHQKSEIEFINAYFSNTWVKGFKDSHLKFERAYRSGSQIGDFFHMACARAASVENDLLFGGNLKDLKAEVLDFKKFVFQTRAIEMQLVLDSVYETALFFTEKTLDNQLNSVVYVDQKIDTNVVNYASKHFIHALFVNKMMRAVFLNDFSDELSTLQTAELLLDESKGMQHSIWHHFYAVIIEENIDLARKNRRRHLSVLRKAAQFNPSNYQVLFDIANLFCHVKNKSQSQLIEELFKITRSNDIDKYVHLKAFCLEKLGRALYRSQEQESFKKVLIEAIEAYELWGAHRFSERLEQEFNLNGISEKPDISEKATLRNNNVDTHITLDNILKASRAISEEIQMDGLVNKVMKVIVQQAVATSAYLILIENSKPVLYAKSVNNHVETMMRLPLTEDALIDQYPIGIINYVMRTAKTIIIDKAIKSELFSSDAFVNATGTKSIYCQPLMLQNQIIGIIFLGNNISENQFKKESFQALDLMSAQMAISINNSMSFERMEETVRQRTAELVIQKEIIEIKNKEISESIQYGRIIQEAIMPNIDALSEYFEGHFIMAKAKDVLSGDFFWSKSIDDVLIFAIADCTGHGVPAALLSLVCLNALNKSVHENNTIDPGEILNYTSQFIEETFEKTKGHSIQDGMDISLCVFDRNTNELKYAGANMPLYIIQPEDDIINGNQLIAEIKGDKQPVGPYFKRNPFTTKSYKLRKKDVLILASDGFADQFGGPNNKKLKQKGFKNLLIRLNIQDFNNQGKWLSEEFEAWKQEEFQVDDVTILGVLV